MVMKSILGTQNVEFIFSAGTYSTVTEVVLLDPPKHAETAVAMLTGFDVGYTDDEQYGFGALQVELAAISEQSLEAKVTLRDDNINKREWHGTVNATVLFMRDVKGQS